MEKKRLAYIDYARGIGIILMIMGHIDFGGAFYKYIHAFHMPIFFVMSGYLYREKDSLVKEIAKKAKQLLIPYILIGAFHYVVWLVLYHNEGNIFEPLLNLLFINTNLNMPIAGALWFLTCLFWVDVIFMVIEKYLKKLSWLIFIAITALGMVFTSITTIRLPWAIDAAMVGVGFYYAGYLLKKYSNISVVNRLMDLKLFEALLGLAIFSVLIIANGVVNMRTGSYSIIPLSFLNGAGFSIVILNICKLAEQKAEKSKMLMIPCNGLKYVGENSIVYLCFNQLCILLLNKVRSVVIPGSASETIMFLVHCAMLVCTMVMLAIGVRILTNKRLKFLIGK